MAYLESKEAKVMNKFHGERLNLKKLKNEMFLALMDLWDVTDGSEGSTFQHGSQNIEGLSKTHQGDYVYHQPQFGGQPTCAH